MILNRKFIASSLAAILIACVVLFQNCNGTRIRSADFSISMGQVQAQIEALSQGSVSSLSASSQQALTDFFDLATTDGAQIYYAEAPSTMGSVDTVLPLDYSNLNVTKPAKAAAYLAVVNFDEGVRAALVVTEIRADGSGSEVDVPLFALSSSQAGTQDESEINLPVLFDGSQNLVLRSNDIIDGQLGEVVQFELIEPVDEENEYTLGLINLVQPN